MIEIILSGRLCVTIVSENRVTTIVILLRHTFRLIDETVEIFSLFILVRRSVNCSILEICLYLQGGKNEVF